MKSDQNQLAKKFVTNAFKTFLHLPIPDEEKLSSDEVLFDADHAFGIISKRMYYLNSVR